MFSNNFKINLPHMLMFRNSGKKGNYMYLQKCGNFSLLMLNHKLHARMNS